MKKSKKKTIIKSLVFLSLVLSIFLPNFSTSNQIESTDFVFKLIHVATYDTLDVAMGVFVVDNIAYIADQHEDLQIVNVTDPSNPTYISTGEFSSSTRYGILVKDNYCYVSGWNNRLPIFDVSNTLTPTIVNSEYGSNDACDFVIINDLIYISDWMHCFYIYDVSDPTAPIALGSYSGEYHASDIEIRGDYAYLATSDGLLILDITDVNNPSYTNLYSTSERVDGLTIVGSYIYLAGGPQGLIILDITDDINPVYVNTYDTPGYTCRVEIKYDHAFACDSSGGLLIIDISNPDNLSLSYELTEYDNSVNIFFSEEYAYLANGVNGLEIFRVSSETAKTENFAILGTFLLIAALIVITNKIKKNKSTAWIPNKIANYPKKQEIENRESLKKNKRKGRVRLLFL